MTPCRCRPRTQCTAFGEIAVDRNVACSEFPFGFGGQSRSCPSRVCIGLVPTDVAHWRSQIERQGAAQCELSPFAIVTRPVARRVDQIGVDPVPTCRQPQFGPTISAVGNEGQQIGVRDRSVSEGKGTQILGMQGRLVVEREAGTHVTDLYEPCGKFDPRWRSAAHVGFAFRARSGVHRAQRVAGQQMQHVGQDQFLMLLLVVQSEFRQRVASAEAARCKSSLIAASTCLR